LCFPCVECTQKDQLNSGDFDWIEQDFTGDSKGPYKPRRGDWADPANGMPEFYRQLSLQVPGLNLRHHVPPLGSSTRCNSIHLSYLNGFVTNQLLRTREHAPLHSIPAKSDLYLRKAVGIQASATNVTVY